MPRRDAAGVRLLTRNGSDWAHRFPLIAEASGALQVKSFLIDGEAVACDDNGVAVFEKHRGRREDRHVFLYAFDLIEINGQDLRREPIEIRKRQLATLLRNAKAGLQLNEHIRRARRGRVPPRLSARARRHGVEAAGLALCLGAITRLAQVQEPRRAGREAGGGRGLGAMTQLILKRAPIGDNLEDYSVLEDSVVVGRIILLSAVAPEDRPWMWASGHSADSVKRAAHGYEPMREAAMAAFAKSRRRG
jgi:hypothetical protein